MSDTPHPTQRKMDIEVDSADLAVYVKLPALRHAPWVPVSVTTLILTAAKRHQWREEINDALKYLNGDSDE